MIDPINNSGVMSFVSNLKPFTTEHTEKFLMYLSVHSVISVVKKSSPIL